MQLKEIRLLGAAGRQFGRVFHLAVTSPAEAVRALGALFPEFHGWVLEQHERGVAWRVVTDQAEGLSEDELERGTSVSMIVLAPVLQGRGGLGKIIAGAVLIAAALIIGQPWLGALAFNTMTTIGGALIFGGVSELLTRTPTLGGIDSPSSTAAERSADLQSNLFSRNQGTSGQGECVPLLYGRRRVEAPRVISFDLRNSTDSRAINISNTRGLLGYVNGQVLS